MPKPLTPEERARQRAEGAQRFLADVLQKIPEDRRTVIAETFKDPGLLDMIGHGLLRQQEFSRFMDAGRDQLNADREQVAAQKRVLDDWWGQNSAAVTRAVALEREVEDLRRRLQAPAVTPADDDFFDPTSGATRAAASAPTAPATPSARASLTSEPNMDPSKFITREALAALAQDNEVQQVRLMSTLNRIGLQHFQEFAEVLDTDDLIAFAQGSNLPLNLAYDQYVKERRETKAQQAVEERIRQAKEDGIREGRAAAAAIPYPVSGQGSENIFSHLGTEKKGPASVAEMAAELQQMISESR